MFYILGCSPAHPGTRCTLVLYPSEGLQNAELLILALVQVAVGGGLAVLELVVGGGGLAGEVDDAFVVGGRQFAVEGDVRDVLLLLTPFLS